MLYSSTNHRSLDVKMEKHRRSSSRNHAPSHFKGTCGSKLTTSHHSKRSQSTIDRGSSPLHSWIILNYLVMHLCKSIFRNSKRRSQFVPCKSISVPLGIPPRSLGNKTITKGPSALSHSSRYYVPCAYTLHKEDHGLQGPYMNTGTMAHQKESR